MSRGRRAPVSPVLGGFLDHRFTVAHASRYLDGELSGPERRRVHRHASVCPRCRALLASLTRLLAVLPSLRGGPQPLRVADGVLERLDAEPGGRAAPG